MGFEADEQLELAAQEAAEQAKKNELQERLNEVFAARGIVKLNDKRKLMRSVLEHDEILNGLSISHYERLIAYIEELDVNQPLVIGWLCSVEKGIGLDRSQAGKLMRLTPQNGKVAMVTSVLEEQALRDIYGYVDYAFFQTNHQPLCEVIQSLSREADAAHGLAYYHLNSALQVTPVQQESSARMK